MCGEKMPCNEVKPGLWHRLWQSDAEILAPILLGLVVFSLVVWIVIRRPEWAATWMVVASWIIVGVVVLSILLAVVLVIVKGREGRRETTPC